MEAKKPYDENSPEVQPDKKIDFNNENDFIEFTKKIASAKSPKDKDRIIDDILNNGLKRKNMINSALAFLKPMISQNPKTTIGVMVLIECALYGIVSQSYSLIKFIINLF